MMKFTRPSLRILAAALASVLFVALFPAGSANAARPVCASSKMVKFDKSRAATAQSTLYLWLRTCVDGDKVSFQLRQKGMGMKSRGINAIRNDPQAEPALEGELTIKVYSTSTNGRFLRDVVKEESVWLGDVTKLLESGTSTRYGFMVYSGSTVLDGVALTGLTPGRYQLTFELALDHVEDDLPAKSTGPRHIKFTI